MKTNLRLGLLALSLSLSLGGILAAATYTKQNARIHRLVVRTDFTGNTGTATAVTCDAYLESLLINEANASDVLPASVRVVSFDLLDPTLTGTAVTAAGKTVTYPQLAALLRQAALDRANAQGVN